LARFHRFSGLAYCLDEQKIVSAWEISTRTASAIRRNPPTQTPFILDMHFQAMHNILHVCAPELVLKSRKGPTLPFIRFQSQAIRQMSASFSLAPTSIHKNHIGLVTDHQTDTRRFSFLIPVSSKMFGVLTTASQREGMQQHLYIETTDRRIVSIQINCPYW
jgi:hypothetical protein